MVTGIGGNSAAAAVGVDTSGKVPADRLAASRDALAKLSAPRAKTEAEQKLDAILHDLRESKGKAALEAARRKLERIKAKLDALKLAAGSAAASGDAKLARRVARDIRDAARDLSRALADAGSSGGGVTPVVAVAGDGGDKAGSQSAPASSKAGAAAGNDDFAGLKSEAQGVLKELRKIMHKLRETSWHPGIPVKDRAEMEKIFAEADRQLAGLDAASAPSGPGVNLVA